MVRWPIQLQVFPQFRTNVSSAWLRRVARDALATGDPGGGASGVTVVLADDDTLRDLNRRFRGFDEVTDVLSFGAATAVSFPEVPDAEPSLGEVVVSYPQALRQAREQGVRAEHEVALLVVHGILHLLGHDHAEPAEEAAMKKLEAQALSSVFPPEVPAARG